MKSWRLMGILGALAVCGAGLSFPRLSHGCCPALAQAEPAKDVAAGVKTAKLRVEGMTCSSCIAAVRMALRKLDGVQDATVKLEEKEATVQYNPAKVTPQQLAEAVTKAGYKAVVLQSQ